MEIEKDIFGTRIALEESKNGYVWVDWESGKKMYGYFCSAYRAAKWLESDIAKHGEGQ